MTQENSSLSPVRATDKIVLTRGLLLLMAIATGISVANLYYIQPLLADIAEEFNSTAGEMGRIATLTQIGYALGLFLFIPLGDIRERRSLIITLLGAAAIALVAVAVSGNIMMLGITSFAVGITSVIPQLFVPLAAQLAEPHQRGQAVGIVMSGLYTGILLARTASGIIGDMFGWRSIYWLAAVAMLILALSLKFRLPECKPAASVSLSYWPLLKSMGKLFLEQSVLRKCALFGAMLFGVVSAFWSTLAFFLKAPPYFYTAQIIGLFGLIGIMGTFYAPIAGRMADKRSPRTVGIFSGVITLLALLTLWGLGYYLWGLILGAILLDIGSRGGQISNQSVVYSLIPEARNRLNTIYMVSYFMGGALGSSLGPSAWGVFGWDGVILVGCIMTIVGMLSFLPMTGKTIK